MKDELIINGKKYVHTPEVKEERLSGWIKKSYLLDDKQAMITPNRHTDDDTRMIQINEGEIIINKDDVMKLTKLGYTDFFCDEFSEILGFKKDGV